jgi:hypothetical protein
MNGTALLGLLGTSAGKMFQACFEKMVEPTRLIYMQRGLLTLDMTNLPSLHTNASAASTGRQVPAPCLMQRCLTSTGLSFLNKAPKVLAIGVINSRVEIGADAPLTEDAGTRRAFSTRH